MSRTGHYKETDMRSKILQGVLSECTPEQIERVLEYAKSVLNEPKKVECPYWIVKSQEERSSVEQKTVRKWNNIGLKFPHIIGIENGFTFQDQNIHGKFEDYHDKKENVMLKYILTELPL